MPDHIVTMLPRIQQALADFSEFMHGGLSKGVPPKGMSEQELAAGIKVEMEHTNNKKIATKIAIDHLAEHADYYTRLKAAGL